LRAKAGLLLPERRIGLSAHDYQQAIAGAQVWITRSIRSDDAQTVPSRWINRLTNLLEGLPDQGGPEALASMRARGSDWLAMAAATSAADEVVEPAHRPSPSPPVSARPKSLPVTAIKTLIRDPYAIYAQRILRLRPLDPLTPSPDAPLRGIVVHTVVERFIRTGIAPDAPEARPALMAIAEEVLAEQCPWPTVRRMWLARIDRVADWFLNTETVRQGVATPEAFEIRGEVALAGLDFTLTAKADRIDRAADGAVLIYDYKTGAPPSAKEQRYFDKQLLLEAAMAERGGFAAIGAARVAAAVYIGLGGTPKEVSAPLDESPADAVWSEFEGLIARWHVRERGYSARMAVKRSDFAGDYDHLARFGEWDLSSASVHEEVG
jgi:ATP-dependent helicase/nuclease subunit B